MAKRRLLLVGWDAADGKIIRSLQQQGALPFLTRLCQSGVSGHLATLWPMLSPMLWTSIATGKHAWKHGVCGFIEPSPTGGVQPVSQFSRRTKAFWNILQQNGLRCHLLGWWPSHPVERLQGIAVSNFFGKSPPPHPQDWPLLPGTVHPARYSELLAGLRVHPRELDQSHLQPFVPLLARIDQERDRRLHALAHIIAETASLHAAATAAMQLEDWDLTAIYYDALDHFSHLFMAYRPPRLPWVTDHDFTLYQHVIDTAYRFLDQMLGALLTLAGEDTTVIVISDHGFHSDQQRPGQLPDEPAGPALEHRPYGIFVAAGPGFRPGAALTGASLLDICPTILHLFGLPVGRDMDGRVLEECLTRPDKPLLVDSWDAIPGPDGRFPLEYSHSFPHSEAALQQLVALGYIEAPTGSQQQQRARALREWQYNHARSLLAGGQWAAAARLLRPLWQQWPEENRFGLHLMRALQQEGRLVEARSVWEAVKLGKQQQMQHSEAEFARLLEENHHLPLENWSPTALARHRKLSAQRHNHEITLLTCESSLLLDEGKPDDALAWLQKIPDSVAQANTWVLCKLGQIHLRRGDAKSAAAAFQRCLTLEPDHPAAQTGLAYIAYGQKDYFRAVGHAFSALAGNFRNPYTHYLLGSSLWRLGWLQSAEQSLSHAVALSPNFRRARFALSRLRKRLGLPPPLPLAAAPPPSSTLAEDSYSPRRFITLQQTPLDPAFRDRTILIVSGLPRSGTSLMMQILQAGGWPLLTDGRRTPDASNPWGYWEYEPATRLHQDAAWLPSACGSAVKIVATLLPCLPPAINYRVIFMERPLEEVVASQQKMLQRLGQPAANPDDLLPAFSQQLAVAKHFLASVKIPTYCCSFADLLDHPEPSLAALRDFLGDCLDLLAARTAIRMQEQGPL